MPELQRVEPEDILPRDGRVTLLTPLQTVGVRGALLVGAVGSIALLALVARWMIVGPTVPSLPLTVDEMQAAAIIGRYKELQSIHVDSTIKMIDAAIVRVLLPVFTTFVGYVFGSQASHRMR